MNRRDARKDHAEKNGNGKPGALIALRSRRCLLSACLRFIRSGHSLFPAEGKTRESRKTGKEGILPGWYWFRISDLLRISSFGFRIGEQSRDYHVGRIRSQYTANSTQHIPTSTSTV